MKILTIIPARGGSKGIPMKNIYKIVGKPLIQYTIEQALNSKLISRTIVSTDDLQIKKIAEKLGAEVPFLRPKKFSKDNSSAYDVVKHTINFLENENEVIPEIIIFLQPTNPLRTSQMIDKSIKLLQKSKGSSVLSVFTRRQHPSRAFEIKNNFLKPLDKNYEKFYQRQKLSKLYYPTGSIYTFWTNTVKKYDSMFGPKIIPMIAEKNELHLDIDNYYDLFVCEMTIKNWKKYEKQIKKKGNPRD
jgi:CMP-N,N'-diacetyllegionaminic acid synthase